MPRRLTPEERLLRDQIKLLSAHISETKRADRAAAKAEALANKPPPLTRAQWRLKYLHTIVTGFEAALAAGPPPRIPPGMPGSMEASLANLEYMKALSALPGARLVFAAHVRNNPSLPEAAALLPWVTKYLAETEAARALYNASHNPN